MTNILQGVISTAARKININLHWKEAFNIIRGTLAYVFAAFEQHVYKHYEKFYDFDDYTEASKVEAIIDESEKRITGKEQEVSEIVKTKTSSGAKAASDHTDVYQYRLKSREAQLPKEGSTEEKVLQKLTSFNSEEFKQVITALFYEIEATKYNINKLGPAGANGFAFYGTLQVSSQFSYEINFVGEARKNNLNEAVDAQHVARVLSMLNGGEYGFFITTSYFTESAQIEVVKENNSLKTIDGKQLVELFKELNLIHNEEINTLWLKRVLHKEPICA
jgi:hypothetical protein